MCFSKQTNIKEETQVDNRYNHNDDLNCIQVISSIKYP